ncbi:MAG: LPS export ABC transporter periplasmic protein LptC [Pseudomonadota bacterium]
MSSFDAALTAENASPAVRPAHRRTPKAVHRHSLIVSRLRLVVPAAAAGVLATYAFSATPPVIDPEFVREFTQLETTASEGMRLDRPRYLGEDLEGTPFEVSARSALRNPNDPTRIALQDPESLRVTKGGTEVMKVKARDGLFDTEKNHIALKKDVEFEHGQATNTEKGKSGFVLNTEAADVDIEAQTVSSTVGVTGKGTAGTVSADKATAYQGEGRLVLEGNVKLRINETSKKQSVTGLR